MHSVDVIRHNVVDVHCPGFPVSQTAAHHHGDLKREELVRGPQQARDGMTTFWRTYSGSWTSFPGSSAMAPLP